MSNELISNLTSSVAAISNIAMTVIATIALRSWRKQKKHDLAIRILTDIELIRMMTANRGLFFVYDNASSLFTAGNKEDLIKTANNLDELGSRLRDTAGTLIPSMLEARYVFGNELYFMLTKYSSLRDNITGCAAYLSGAIQATRVIATSNTLQDGFPLTNLVTPEVDNAWRVAIGSKVAGGTDPILMEIESQLQ